MKERTPRLDEAFAYSGDGSRYDPGFPGYDFTQDCGISTRCYAGYPETEDQYNELRSLPWGLGQATTGYYS